MIYFIVRVKGHTRLTFTFQKIIIIIIIIIIVIINSF